MTLTLELTAEQEQHIEAEARRRNMDAASYAKALLFEEEAAEAGEEQTLPPAGPPPRWRHGRGPRRVGNGRVSSAHGPTLRTVWNTRGRSVVRRKGAPANDNG